jgi:uncharacterized protein (TIGR03086 family)
MRPAFHETWPGGGHFRRDDQVMNNTLLPTDPRSSFAHAVITARAVIAQVTPDQMVLATPCPEHDVRSMLGHMLTVLERITALGNGDDPMAMPDVVTGVADEQWSSAFVDAAHRVQTAWTDSAKLERPMHLPWATAPGAAMLQMYTAELTVHTWDLAVAIGHTVEWHEPTLQVALQSALHALPSGDREAYFEEMAKDARFTPDLAVRPPFRNPVPVADDASTLDRLVGWYGRQPLPSVA